ncbi:MAG: autotransporter-associated beta strand repeat-containing protein [Luteolibacter sp.]
MIVPCTVASLSLLGSFSAFATSDAWDGSTSALWSLNTNWATDPVAVPGTSDTATFNNAGNGNTIIDLGAGVTIGTIIFDTSSAAAYTLGTGAAGSQTLTLGTLAGGIQMNSGVAANELINANLALSTTGTYAVGLTNNSTTKSLTVAGGISASTSGAKVLTLTGAGNTSVTGNIIDGTGTVSIIKTGAGTATLSGTNTFSGGVAANAGTLSFTGNSTISTGTLNVGNVASTQGKLNLAGTTSLTGSAGFVNLAGSATSSTGVVNVGSGNTLVLSGANGGNIANGTGASGAVYNAGTFNQTATTVNNAGIYLGNAANTYGYLRNSGNTTLSGRLWVAQAGNAAGATGVLDIRGGTVSVNPTGNFTAGQRLQINGDGNTHATSTSYAGVNVINGTLTVGGSAAQTNINTGQNEYTSMNITGTGKFTAGTSGTDSGIGLGVTSIATNTATLSIANGGTLETSYIYNTNALGTGVISIDNGTIRSIFNNATGIIQGTNTKTFIQSGGATFDTNGFATTVPNALLAPTGNGVNSITLGGTATGYVGAPVVKISGGGGTGAAAVANFDPTTGTITGITITSAGSGYTSAPTVTLVGGNGGATGAGVGTATATSTVTAVTSGGLTKTGAGTLTLSAANTYTGTTTISNGTLKLASTGSIGNSSTIINNATYDVSAVTAYTVGASQTLAGSGNVIGNTTIAGTLAIGNSPGMMTFNNNLTLANIATMELGGSTTAGTDYDYGNVLGTLTYGGALNVISYNGYNLAQIAAYNLFDAGTITGDFSSVSVGGLGLSYFSGTDSWSGSTGSITYTFTESTGVLTAVPEPGAALLGGLGMLALLRRRRR